MNQNTVSILSLIGFVGLLFMLKKDAATTRGIRNNNPFNIKDFNIAWSGKTGNDGVFVTFSSAEYGIRAGMKLLINYERLHGINTVFGIINRFAPGVENPTSNYVEFVAEKLGVDAQEEININQNLFLLTDAIIKFENGYNPYSVETLENAYRLI